MNKYVIFIGGPTASGKTSMAIELAKIYQCDIISADSRQFYKEISIGTAKPTIEDRAGVKHHFIDSLSIGDPYSAGQFERDALHLIKEKHRKQDYVIVVGGTGLYHRAIYQGLDAYPKVEKNILAYYDQILSSKGISILQEELRLKDPTYASKVDMDNPQRLIRALSVIKVSNKTFSSFQTSSITKRKFQSIMLSINLDRVLLYQRINKRVDSMIQEGLIQEAKSVYHLRYLNSLNTVGYSELFKYFDGIWTKNEAIEKIKQHTRNYAKRQITWFKNQDDWTQVQDLESAGTIINKHVSQN